MSMLIAKSKKTLVTIYLGGYEKEQRFKFYVNSEQEKYNLTELILSPDPEIRKMSVDIILSYKYWDKKCRERFTKMIEPYLRGDIDDMHNNNTLKWYKYTRVNVNYGEYEYTLEHSHWPPSCSKLVAGVTIYCIPVPYIFIL